MTKTHMMKKEIVFIMHIILKLKKCIIKCCKVSKTALQTEIGLTVFHELSFKAVFESLQHFMINFFSRNYY